MEVVKNKGTNLRIACRGGNETAVPYYLVIYLRVNAKISHKEHY